MTPLQRNRNVTWLVAALALALPSVAWAQGFPPPSLVPAVVPPLLEPGFPPLPPDRFGRSPTGETAVFFTGGELVLIRLADGVVLFRERFPTFPSVGFSVDGDVLVVRVFEFGSRTTIRWIDTATGSELARLRFPVFAQVLVSPFGEGFLVLAPRFFGTEAIVLNDTGSVVFRRTVAGLVRIGFGTDAFAVVDRFSFGSARVGLFSLATGELLLRAGLRAPFAVGFSPRGDRFLLASSSFGIARVRLFRTADGVPLLNQTFRDLLLVGFTPEGELLVVVTRQFGQTRVFLFSAQDGRRIL